MNKSHRDVFSRFYRLPVLDWRILVARLGGKKYRSAARMIFFRPTGPEDRLAPKGRNPIPLPCKNGKTSSLPSEPELFPVCQEIKKRMRTFRSASFLCVYSPVLGSFLRLAGTENLVRNLSGEFGHFPKKDFRREFAPLHARQPGLPARSQRCVCNPHSSDRLVNVEPFPGWDEVASRIADVFAVDQRLDDARTGGGRTQSRRFHVADQFRIGERTCRQVLFPHQIAGGYGQRVAD